MYVLHPRVRGILIILLGTLLGCRAETFGVSDNSDLGTDPVVLVPTRQWSGGEITLVSKGLAGLRDGRFTVRVGDRDVPTTRIAPDSLRVQIPADLPSGQYPVTLTAEGVDWEVGPVVAVGWSTRSRIGATLCSDPTPWPLGRPEGILIASCLLDQSPLFVSTEGQMIVYSGLVGSGYSPSVSYRANAINDRLGRVVRLHRFSGGWDSLAASPAFYSRHGYELGPGVWLNTSNHSGDLWNQTTGTLTSVQLESEWLLVRSTAGPRATFVVSAAFPGVPILDTENGTILARMDGLSHTDAAVFSPDGDTLFAVASQYSCCGASFLTRIATETGAILQIDSTRAGGYALAVDAGTPGWLYELAEDSSQYRLRVRNATDLAVVAEFRTPAPVRFSGTYPGLVIDAARRHGYVFVSDYPRSHILRFDLLIPGD